MESKWITILFFTLTVSIGGVMFSQGLSFAQWNPHMGVDYFIDMHAWLLGIAGVGVFVAGIWCHRLHGRIAKLEQRLGPESE